MTDGAFQTTRRTVLIGLAALLGAPKGAFAAGVSLEDVVAACREAFASDSHEPLPGARDYLEADGPSPRFVARVETDAGLVTWTYAVIPVGADGIWDFNCVLSGASKESGDWQVDILWPGVADRFAGIFRDHAAETGLTVSSDKVEDDGFLVTPYQLFKLDAPTYEITFGPAQPVAETGLLRPPSPSFPLRQATFFYSVKAPVAPAILKQARG